MDYSLNAEAGPSSPSTDLHATAATWPSAPDYIFTSPSALASIDINSLSPDLPCTFFRSARWTTDATSILTTAEDRVLRVLDTPEGAINLHGKPRSFRQPDSVVAAQWYPSASARSPETFCFVVSVRDTPVRLVDASDGRVRATYPIVDHRERFISPHCMAFNLDATRLYCGFENAIEVLDIASPGYNNAERIKTSFTRRDKGGQKGIISAIAFNPHVPGSYAAASFSGSVALYDEDTGGRATDHLDGVEKGGVTQVAFHPLNPHGLFVASRRSEAIQVYDTRDTSAPVAVLSRSCSTNQRLHIDVDPWGRYLAAGDEFGTVRVWDIMSPEYSVLLEEKLHNDAVNAVQFHPYQPFLLTSAGSRAFLKDESESDSESDDESEEERDDQSHNEHNERNDDASLEHEEAVATLVPSPVRSPRRSLTVWSMRGSLAEV